MELLSENHWIHPSNDIAYESTNADDGKLLNKIITIYTKKKKYLLEYEDESYVTPSQAAGRVVGILNRNWRSYVATIQEDSAEAGGSIHLAIPLDPVIPKIRIRYHDVKLIENQRIVVRIDNW